MEQTISLLPGVTLRCMHSSRFKQGAFSIQFLRPMRREEAGWNALLPAVLLRGCRQYPDLRRITQRLDDLYGASIDALVRRVGDYQTTGFYCGFVEDRFALPGDTVLAPVAALAGELLRDPVTGDDGFCGEFVDNEKKNLIAAIESQRSDKRAYAAAKLLTCVCGDDPFGIPRLGEAEQVREIDCRGAYAHYRRVLEESPVEIFYAGSAEAEQVAALLEPVFDGLPRNVRPLPPQSPLRAGPGSRETETMEIAQARLAMGYVTPITNRDPRFAAMQVCSAVFGGGMTSKLFMQVREKMSLCYAIGAAYYGSKGILTVNAGIDTNQEPFARAAIAGELAACQRGEISPEELRAAKESILSGLRAVYDSPGAMEGFFSTAAISGLDRTPESYAEEIRAVTAEDAAAAARTLELHSSFFLKGEENE